MSILEQLQLLPEKPDFRKKIIIPLMGLLSDAVYDLDGRAEKGKDVLYQTRNIFDEIIFGAILLKNNGKIGKGKDMENITRQAAEAMADFSNPRKPMELTRIRELTIMTSFELTEESMVYIRDQVGRYFPNIHFVDGQTLENIIVGRIDKRNQTLPPTQRYSFSPETFKDFCESCKGGVVGDFSNDPPAQSSVEGQSL